MIESMDDSPTAGIHAGLSLRFCCDRRRPNVGKSTLLNALLKHKREHRSRLSPRPRGIAFCAFSPKRKHRSFSSIRAGIHTDERRMMNRYMNKSALASLSDAASQFVRGRSLAVE